MKQVFHFAHIIAFGKFRRINITIQRENPVGRRIDGRIAYERTSHEIPFDIPESAHFDPGSAFEPEKPIPGRKDFRCGHIGAVARPRNAGGETVAGSQQRLLRKGLLPFVRIGIEHEALARSREFVPEPEEIIALLGQDVAFGNLHLHAELFSNELAGFRLIELVGESDRAVALGPFEGLHQLRTMLRDILRKCLPGRSLKRHHDLRRSRDIVLHTGRSRRKGGIDEHFEDIAVIDDRTFESRFRELHHVEQRFPFVQIGNRSQQHRTQRIPQLALPQLLVAHDNQFVRCPLSGFEFRIHQSMERFTARHEGNEQQQCQQIR